MCWFCCVSDLLGHPLDKVEEEVALQSASNKPRPWCNSFPDKSGIDAHFLFLFLNLCFITKKKEVPDFLVVSSRIIEHLKPSQKPGKHKFFFSNFLCLQSE